MYEIFKYIATRHHKYNVLTCSVVVGVEWSCTLGLSSIRQTWRALFRSSCFGVGGPCKRDRAVTAAMGVLHLLVSVTLGGSFVSVKPRSIVTVR